MFYLNSLLSRELLAFGSEDSYGAIFGNTRLHFHSYSIAVASTVSRQAWPYEAKDSSHELVGMHVDINAGSHTRLGFTAALLFTSALASL